MFTVQEASVARREHILALQREFIQLQQLSPDEAVDWQQRREENAVKRLQRFWRQLSNRRSFLEVVHRSKMHRRAKAATTIQRAQRTRQRVVAEAAPPISKEQVSDYQSKVVERTLAMVRDLTAARAAQAAWRANGGEQAALDAGLPATSAAAKPPPMPAWTDHPEWERTLKRDKPGGSTIVHELRDAAIRGLHAERPTDEISRQLRQWPQLRASMQAAAVRRQVLRTQAASLFPQLRHPPKLPTAPAVEGPIRVGRETDAASSLALPPMMPSKPKILVGGVQLTP